MSELWLVRVSPQQQQVIDDFDRLNKTIETRGQGLWDQDYKNEIKEGDYLAFIHGDKNKEQMYIYKVDKICTTDERLEQWASSRPYTRGNGINAVNHRHAIVLVKNHSIETYDWRDFRRSTGLGKACKSWMPRGTSKVLNKEKLPFILPSNR